MLSVVLVIPHPFIHNLAALNLIVRKIEYISRNLIIEIRLALFEPTSSTLK